jgi:hypothetical protein
MAYCLLVKNSKAKSQKNSRLIFLSQKMLILPQAQGG